MSITTTEVPAEFKEHVSQNADWREIVKWVGDLPPLPHVAAKALVLIDDPDVNAIKLTNLLGQDTALTARVLKIANSAMFARQREITTINQAVMLIGFKALKGIIVAATMRQLNRKPSPTEKMVWENSTCTAIAAQLLAKSLKKSYADELFVLGLLHDLGKLVLLLQIPDKYLGVFSAVRSGKLFVDAEQQELGCTHALVGALVAKKWNFSEEACQIILHHHDPVTSSLEPLLAEKISLIQTADALAHSLGYGHPDGYPDLKEQALASANALGLPEEELESLIETIATTYESSSSVFLS
jgi:HD-like signal output (HDOD) protein